MQIWVQIHVHEKAEHENHLVENGQRHGDPELLNQTQTCQNDRKLDAIGSIAAEKMIVR